MTNPLHVQLVVPRRWLSTSGHTNARERPALRTRREGLPLIVGGQKPLTITERERLEMLSTRLVPLHLNVKYDSQINGTVVTDFKQTL